MESILMFGLQIILLLLIIMVGVVVIIGTIYIIIMFLDEVFDIDITTIIKNMFYNWRYRDDK